jgi:hypothetical protein
MTQKPSNAEEEFFARQEAEKKHKLALEKQQQMKAAEREALKQAHLMRCPKCGNSLEEIKYRGISIDRCYTCNGTWLDEGELEQLAGKEPGFVQKMTSIFRPGTGK